MKNSHKTEKKMNKDKWQKHKKFNLVSFATQHFS